MASDTGTFEITFSRIAKSSVNMIVAGDKRHIFTMIILLNYIHRKLYIFQSRSRLIFEYYILFGNSFFNQVSLHGFRFGDAFIGSLSAGWNDLRRSIILPVNIYGLVDTISQKSRNPVTVQKSGTMNDYILEVLPFRNYLKENNIYHKHQK